MKIGIVTLPLHSNYGGILQAWALQTVLTRMGHDVKIIDRDLNRRISDWFFLYPKRIWRKYVLKQNIPVFQEQVQYKTVKSYSFIEKNIYRRCIRDFSEIKRNEFDALVFGSDQVWRPMYFLAQYHKMTDAFGRFAKSWGVLRLSYAASFGVNELNEYRKKEIRSIKEELQAFRGVSVREASGVEICKKYFDVDAVHVLDPTLLVSQKDYLKLAVSIPEFKNRILEYILDLDDMKKAIIERVCTVERSCSVPFPREDSLFPVEEWIAGFRDAKLIVTDSFHACVFSIIFQKPFVVIANPIRGFSRIESLLKIFNLQHHLVTDISQVKSIDSYKIDSSIYDILAKWQSKSMDFLISSLSN